MPRKFFPTAATYLILTFAIAASWHLALFKGVYDELGVFTRKEPIIPLGISAMLLQACVVGYLAPIVLRGARPVMDGVKFGLLLGVFMGSSAVLAEAGKNEVGSLSTWIGIESIYYLLQFVIIGAAIGFVHRRGGSNSSAPRETFASFHVTHPRAREVESVELRDALSLHRIVSGD